MRKKKEYPRKRKRFIKKVNFFLSFFFALFVVAIGIAFYLLFLKFQKPLFISPVPALQIAQADQGEFIDQQVEKTLQKKHIEYISVKAQNDAIIVTLPNKSTVTFSSQKDIMSQIASLQYILSHLTMEGRQFSSLDLRFDQPVIVIK